MAINPRGKKLCIMPCKIQVFEAVIIRIMFRHVPFPTSRREGLRNRHVIGGDYSQNDFRWVIRVG
jgi:hypothetical protein